MNDLWAVTGASGYLGRALRADLDESAIPSRGLARRGGVELVADVRDREVVRSLVRGASVVVHLAAYVHRAQRSKEAVQECWSINVDGTQTLIDALTALNPNAFTIFVSSANVYGPSDGMVDELSRPNPCTPYGRTKLEAEGRFRDAVQTSRIRGCILRPALIFGPGAPGNLGRLASMVRSGWVLEIARGEQRKSIVPVSHAVGAIRAVASQQTACNGEVINVAGEAFTIHEIVSTLASERVPSPRIISVPSWLAKSILGGVSLVAPSLSMATRPYMNNNILSGDKLVRLTGFHPSEAVSSALKRIG